METGEYQIGTDPKRNKTGKGTAVRIIKVKSIKLRDEAEATSDEEVDLFYALGNNLRIYKVEEKYFENPGFKNEKVEALKEKSKEKYKSYLGYDFGETIPPNVSGYNSMLEEIFGTDVTEEDLETGHLVFLGMEPDEDDPESEENIRLCWVLKEQEEDDANDAMDEVLIEKQTFVKRMLIPMDTPKRMTVHYINLDGEKTQMAVDSQNEVTDMKEFLYKFDN